MRSCATLRNMCAAPSIRTASKTPGRWSRRVDTLGGVYHMAERVQYRLKITAYSPDTMPMKRLAEYLADISWLFGEEAYVHLIAIEAGSTCPVLLIDDEAEPRILE